MREACQEPDLSDANGVAALEKCEYFLAYFFVMKLILGILTIDPQARVLNYCFK